MTSSMVGSFTLLRILLNDRHQGVTVARSTNGRRCIQTLEAHGHVRQFLSAGHVVQLIGDAKLFGEFVGPRIDLVDVHSRNSRRWDVFAAFNELYAA
jgi:hypothetical protein